MPRPSRPTTLTCRGCGRSFIVHRWQANQDRKFCTRSCSMTGEHNPAWKGGTSLGVDGYVEVTADHLAGGKGRRVRQHVRVAELALGKSLPAGAVVHHVNGDRADNRPSNLVICQNQAYHLALHKRMEARERQQESV